jgi:TAG lipase/steryl ester hydrolase/phospholipase A2/LPA acyltransferase
LPSGTKRVLVDANMGRLTRIRHLRREMKQAETYRQWLAAAEALDAQEGNDVWRREDESPLYDSHLLRQHLEQMRVLRRDRQGRHLISVLRESLHRHLGEISNPALYHYAHAGTKRLISDFLDEAAKVMRLLCDLEIQGFSVVEKLRLFEQAYHNFGRSALILSGGISFGIYHLGVAKAMWSEGLLPKIISGSSMGAIVAAGICSRTEDELSVLFNEPDTIHCAALKLAKPWHALRDRHLLDQEQLAEHIRANVGHYTFRETFERTGRVLNITVSPTRTRQKPRVFNHLTAPHVLVDQSALASCAMPFGYPPVMLRERRRNGRVAGYVPTERWIDGSLQGDVPMLRLGRLHNVNHSIVSQANPHVLPFFTAAESRWHDRLGLAGPLLDRPSPDRLVARDLAAPRRRLLAAVAQPGPRGYNPALPRRHLDPVSLYTDAIPQDRLEPRPEGLRLFTRLGEQATWPQMAIIRDQTLLARTFDEVIAKLRRRATVERGVSRLNDA